MIKRKNFRQFRRVKTPEMNDGCRNRSYARATALAEKFERNTRMTEKAVWQDEKGFTVDQLTFLLNYKMTGYMEKEKNLMFQMRTCLRPRIRCQEKLWFPLQPLGTASQNHFL